jgi:hypothetical protein
MWRRHGSLSYALTRNLQNITNDTCYAVIISGAPAARLLCQPANLPPPLHTLTVGLTFPQLISPCQSFLSVSSVPPNCRQSVSYCLIFYLSLVMSSLLNMEATRSCETSVYNKPTRRHVPEDGILHSHRRENLKSYTAYFTFQPTANSVALVRKRTIPTERPPLVGESSANFCG